MPVKHKPIIYVAQDELRRHIAAAVGCGFKAGRENLAMPEVVRLAYCSQIASLVIADLQAKNLRSMGEQCQN